MDRTEFKAHVNAGCSCDLTMTWLPYLTKYLDGGYTLRKFSCDAKGYKTNTTSNTAFRGYGGPEGQVYV